MSGASEMLAEVSIEGLVPATFTFILFLEAQAFKLNALASKQAKSTDIFVGDDFFIVFFTDFIS